MSKRILTHKDVFKTRSRAHQSKAAQKRTRVGEALEYVHQESEEVDVPRSVAAYLDLLWTLLLGYAKAGVTRVSPQPPEPERRGALTTRYVLVPLDVVTRYFDRAAQASSRLPAEVALSWLTKRDSSERLVWIDKFSNSTMTLGEIIAETAIQREGLWESPEILSRPLVVPQEKNGVAQPSKQQQQQHQRQVNQTKWATTLRNGTPLCSAFQRGECTNNRKCPKGAHLCGAMGANNRICGARHSAIHHRTRVDGEDL